MSINTPTDLAGPRSKIISRAIGWGTDNIQKALASFIDRLHNLPPDYPNYLAAPEPEKRRLPFRPLVLLGLTLLCLIPRTLIALRIDSICPDGIRYIQLAEALKEGRFHEAFEGMRLNVFPVALMLLNRLGLEWETAGPFWCVLISSLVVLPLYGFVRRQFDDTVALVACVLYAVHPIIIQLSPEIIRDPTFWFVFTLSLYLSWRAMTEVRLVFSLAAGLAATLAVLTRYEGFLLLIPISLWTFWRYRALSSRRIKIKLAAGSALLVTTFPALLALINITWLRHHSEWVFFRDPLARICYWYNTRISGAPIDTAGLVHQSQTEISIGRMIMIYVPSLVKAFSPLFGLLALGGLWRWRSAWRRRDHQPLFYVSLAIMLSIGFFIWTHHEACDRYFLMIIVMASPFAALGLLGLSKRILRFAECLKTKTVIQYIAVCTPGVIVALTGWAVAFSGPFQRRAAERELASWVRNQFGPSAMLCGSEGITTVVAYHAQVRWTTFHKTMDDATVLNNIQASKADVILLYAMWRREFTETRRLIDKIIELGYTEMERENLPRGTNKMLVVLRRSQVQLSAAVESGTKSNLQK